MYNISNNKLIREYGWATQTRQYSVEVEAKKYRPGREPEKVYYHIVIVAR